MCWEAVPESLESRLNVQDVMQAVALVCVCLRVTEDATGAYSDGQEELTERIPRQQAQVPGSGSEAADNAR